MIELCYHCPDCHTYLSGWFPAEDGILQPEECLFCGSKQAFVYLSDVESFPVEEPLISTDCD